MGSFGPTTLDSPSVEYDDYNDDAGDTGLNIISYYSYDDNNQNTIGSSFHNKHHVIYITSNVGGTVVPAYGNGGSGVAWDVYLWDPDSQVFRNRQVDFTQAGNNGNTFQILIDSGGGYGTIQRTSGSYAYDVYVSRVSGGG